MGNMGYCRFRNTLEDLRDCEEHIYDQLDDEDEMKARQKLIKLCMDITAQFADDED